MTTHSNKYGYEKIKEVSVEIFTEPRYVSEHETIEVPVDGYVWIETTAGDVFAVSPRHGENEEQIAAAYRKRGWTDDRCVLAFPKQHKTA